MQIIPVMDLSNARVVHAVKGKRQNYKTIDSQICSSSKPRDVIDGFLSVHDFKVVYIADLDALENQGNNAKLINVFCKQFPKITFWLDCGINSIEHFIRHIDVQNMRYILSSESISSISSFTSIFDLFPKQDFILSLDFKSDQFLGSSALLSNERYWTNDLIVINLNEVGANNGFICPGLIKQRNLAKNYKLYVGGGIRSIDDIAALSKKSVKGVLISTALHSKAITNSDLNAFNQSL